MSFSIFFVTLFIRDGFPSQTIVAYFPALLNIWVMVDEELSTPHGSKSSPMIRLTKDDFPALVSPKKRDTHLLLKCNVR